MPMNKRKVGADWEQKAVEYLTANGMEIAEQNFRCRQGEIDIVGRHKGYLVFVEVKYRTSAQKGYAAEAVNYGKQRRICRVADYYRVLHKIGSGVGIRYDVVAIQEDKIEWIQNAFMHIYQ